MSSERGLLGRAPVGKFVDKPDSHSSVISVGTAYGLWIALLAAIAVVVGAYLRMTESPT